MYIKENCVLLVALTPEIYCIHGGGLLVLLWRGGENTTFFSFLFCRLFFPLLLSFPEKRWNHPCDLDSPTLSDFSLQSKCSVWSPSTCFSQTSDLIQVSSHSSHSPFLLFRRSLVCLLLTKTVFSNILLHFPLEFQFFLLLIPSGFFFCLLLTFSPQHKHILSCPVLPKETS